MLQILKIIILKITFYGLVTIIAFSDYVFSQISGNVVTVTAFIDSAGNIDDGIESALKQLPVNDAILYFPKGHYTINRTIMVDSLMLPSNGLVIAGDGDSTIVDISNKNAYTKLTALFNATDTVMYVESIDGWCIGDGITANTNFYSGRVIAIDSIARSIKVKRSAGHGVADISSYVTQAVPIFVVQSGYQNVGYLSLKNIKLIGSKNAYTSSNVATQIFLSINQELINIDATRNYNAFDTVIVENVKFYSSSAEGLIANANNVKVRSCSFVDISRDGLHVSGASSSWEITNNQFIYNWHSGIYFCEGGDSITIRSNTFRNCVMGIRGIGGDDHDVDIVDNIFQDPMGDGIVVSSGASFITIEENTFTGISNKYTALGLGSFEETYYLTPGYQWSVRNNTIINWETGIKLSHIEESFVSNNNILNCDTAILLTKLKGYSWPLNAVQELEYPFENRVDSNYLANNIVGVFANSIGNIDTANIFFNNTLLSNETNSILVNPNHITPRFINTPGSLISISSPYEFFYKSTYDTTLIENNVVYTLTQLPSWLNNDTLNKIIFGTPSLSDTGSYLINVEVTDSYLSNNALTYELLVVENHAPFFVSQPNTSAIEDSLYVYESRAIDIDSNRFGDFVRYCMINKPSWVSIDTATGIIRGIPRMQNLFDSVFTVQAYDILEVVAEQKYILHIQHVNHNPIIVNQPDSVAHEDSLYLQSIVAYDPDSSLFGDVLRFQLSIKPFWLQIDSISGRITGTPQALAVGDTIIQLTVSDNNGGSATRRFNLSVKHTNHAPFWVIEPDTIAKEDSLFSSQLFARDTDSLLFGDYIRYRIIEGPSWVTVDSLTGQLTGTPSNNTEGDTVLSMAACDQLGAASIKRYNIHIFPTNYSPTNVNAIYPLSADTMILFRIPIQRAFRWSAAKDPDIGDTVRYTFKLKGDKCDTTITGIIDTFVVIDGGILSEQVKYFWCVSASDGEFVTSNPDSFNFQTTKRLSNSTYTETPTKFFFYQNYPNPFNPTTTIRFQVPEMSKVRIEVYNILGQLVQVVFKGSLDAKYYEMEWRPNAISSGIYFIKFHAESIVGRKKYQSVKKMSYIK